MAKHGHSRDGKPHNVQVIVAVVMVAGWPIAHHVWAGNEVDHTTVGKAIADLHRRFGFNRLVFVGDRGMVTNNNLDAISAGKHGYLVGLKRRRNKKLDKWLAAVDEAKWINCPVGITAREKTDPPRTRAQEVPSGITGMRVIVVDSDERRASEEAMRVKSIERTRQALEKLQLRIAAGKLKQPEKIGAAAERLLQRSQGYRYYSWEIHQGGFRYFENAAGLGSEKGIEGKYVIATSESGLSVLEVVAIYKDLSDVERGFRQLKDMLAMRPIYHQIYARLNAHIFVASLALLVQRLLDRRLEEAGINSSAERAIEALQTVRLVTFRLDDRPERRGVSGGCPDACRVLNADFRGGVTRLIRTQFCRWRGRFSVVFPASAICGASPHKQVPPHFLPPSRRVSPAFILASLSSRPLICGPFPHDELLLPWDQTARPTSQMG